MRIHRTETDPYDYYERLAEKHDAPLEMVVIIISWGAFFSVRDVFHDTLILGSCWNEVGRNILIPMSFSVVIICILFYYPFCV